MSFRFNFGGLDRKDSIFRGIRVVFGGFGLNSNGLDWKDLILGCLWMLCIVKF